MKIRFWLTVLSLSLSIVAFAKEHAVQYPVNGISEVKAKDMEKIELTTDVIYPNGCYRPSYSWALVDPKLMELDIVHYALTDSGKCPQIIVPRSVPIDVDRPADGRYKVIDSLSNRYFGDLVVSDQSVRFDGSLKGNVM